MYRRPCIAVNCAAFSEDCGRARSIWTQFERYAQPQVELGRWSGWSIAVVRIRPSLQAPAAEPEALCLLRFACTLSWRWQCGKLDTSHGQLCTAMTSGQVPELL